MAGRIVGVEECGQEKERWDGSLRRGVVEKEGSGGREGSWEREQSGGREGGGRGTEGGWEREQSGGREGVEGSWEER